MVAFAGNRGRERSQNGRQQTVMMPHGHHGTNRVVGQGDSRAPGPRRQEDVMFII